MTVWWFLTANVVQGLRDMRDCYRENQPVRRLEKQDTRELTGDELLKQLKEATR